MKKSENKSDGLRMAAVSVRVEQSWGVWCGCRGRVSAGGAPLTDPRRCRRPIERPPRPCGLRSGLARQMAPLSASTTTHTSSHPSPVAFPFLILHLAHVIIPVPQIYLVAGQRERVAISFRVADVLPAPVPWFSVPGWKS